MMNCHNKELIKIFLGASRVEFAISFNGWKYEGTINGRVYIVHPDFEFVREELFAGIELPKEERFH